MSEARWKVMMFDAQEHCIAKVVVEAADLSGAYEAAGRLGYPLAPLVTAYKLGPVKRQAGGGNRSKTVWKK
jgi:hypothetical protein